MTDLLYKSIHTKQLSLSALLLVSIPLSQFSQSVLAQAKSEGARLNPARTSGLVLSTTAVTESLRSDDSLAKAFDAFWRGQVTMRASDFQQAANRVSRLLINPSISLPTRHLWLAQRAVFRQFSQFLSERYESSSTLSHSESRQAWRDQLSDIDRSLAYPNLPDSLRAGLFVAKGLAMRQLFQRTSSRQAFNRAQNLFHDWAYLNALLSDFFTDQGVYDEAEELLNQSCRQDSTVLLARYLLGWVYSKTNRLNEAEQIAKQLIRTDSKFYFAYNLLAAVYEQWHRDDEVKKQYNTLLGINPRWTIAYTNFSNFYKNREQYEQALKLANQANSIHPETCIVYSRIASIYRALGKKDSVLSYYKKCYKLDSAYAHDIGNYYFDKFTPEGYKEAEQWYQIALKADSTNSFTNYRLGQIRRLNGNYQQAVPFYQQAIRTNRKYVKAYVMLGECYGKLNQRVLAIDNYERALKLMPNDTANLYKLGYQYANEADSLLKIKQIIQAQNILEKGARLGHPQCADLAYGLKAEFSGIEAESDGYKDEADSLFKIAQYWYLRAALHIPFHKIAHAGLIRLYDDKKIPMNTKMYSFWKGIEEQPVKSISVPCQTEYGEQLVSIYLFNDYLPGVHPLAYEKERVKLEQDKAVIPHNFMQEAAIIYLKAKKEEKSFLKKLNESEISDKEMELISNNLHVPQETNTSLFYILIDEKASNEIEKLLRDFYNRNKRKNARYLDVLNKAKASEEEMQSLKKIYRIAKRYKTDFINLLSYAKGMDNDTGIRKNDLDIKAVERKIILLSDQPNPNTYLALLDTLAQLYEKRLLLGQDNYEHREKAATSYLTLGKQWWRLAKDSLKLLQATKQAFRLDSTNGETVRWLALAWVLAPEGDSLQQHHMRFNTQLYKGHPFQDYFFDDLDSLQQSAGSSPLAKQFYSVVNTPYQQARKGRYSLESALHESEPVKLKELAKGYEADSTKEGRNNARQVYQRLTTLKPNDTTFAVQEWQALLRINGKTPPYKADSVRLNELYSLFLHSRNSEIVRQSIYDYNSYADQLGFDQLETRLSCHEKLVELHRHWLTISPNDKEARDGLSNHLYWQGYFQLCTQKTWQALISADEGLGLAAPEKADHCRALVAMTKVYWGQFTGAEPELKRLGDLKWNGEPYYLTYGDWMLGIYQLLKLRGKTPPEDSKFQNFLKEIIHDDELLYKNGLLSDDELLTGDVSQQKLWLRIHLRSDIPLQTYRSQVAKREDVLKTLFDYGQTSGLLEAARSLRHRVQQAGIGRDEALYFARQARDLYSRVGNKFGEKAEIQDTLAIEYGSLAYSFLKWESKEEALQVIKDASKYNLDEEQYFRTLPDFERTSRLLEAAQSLRYRVQEVGADRDEALYFARQARDLYDQIDRKFREQPGIKASLASGYGSLAYSFLKRGAHKEALQVVKKAFEYNPNEDYTLTNLPLAYLLNDEFDKARALYLDIAKRRWKADQRYETYREVFLSDLMDLESSGIHHPDFNRIRALLR